jgi:hypothetical protein
MGTTRAFVRIRQLTRNTSLKLARFTVKPVDKTAFLDQVHQARIHEIFCSRAAAFESQ